MTESHAFTNLQTEIRQVQAILQRLLAIPGKERSPLFRAALLDAIGETGERLLDLLVAQSIIRPGARAEFNRQVDEVIDEVVAGWEEIGRKAEAERERAENER